VKLWDARTGELQRTLMIPTAMPPPAGALPLR
jgi:hypothetical protein